MNTMLIVCSQWEPFYKRCLDLTVIADPPLIIFSLLHQMADKSQTGALEGDEFVLFYKMLTQREDILKIFQEYSSDGQKLSHSDLENFLKEEQLEKGDVQLHAQEIIEHYEPSDTGT